MRPTLPALLLLLVAAPSAQACSLAYQPFDQPQWVGGALHFVDGSRLQRVDGALESTVAEGFFITYAPAGDALLVAGQEGLGAGCEGDSWLRLYHAGAVAWQRDMKALVFPHADGPVVVSGGKVYRFAGGDLADTGRTVPDNVWVEGVTRDGKPVYRDGEALVVGDWTTPTSSTSMLGVAHSSEATAVASQGDDGRAHAAFFLADGTLTSTTWDASERGRIGVAAADGGWVVMAGGRAFRLAAGPVTDLGVGAVAVAARGAQAAVFQDSGYTVFEGGRPVEAWTRTPDGSGATWTPAALQAPPTSGTSVSADSTSGSAAPAPPPPPADGNGIPAAPAALLLAGLAVAAALRRR